MHLLMYVHKKIMVAEAVNVNIILLQNLLEDLVKMSGDLSLNNPLYVYILYTHIKRETERRRKLQNSPQDNQIMTNEMLNIGQAQETLNNTV